MLLDPNYVGRNGLYYFTGIVEGRLDPLKLGRVQVRCYGIHSDLLSEMPTADLPWFYVASPTTSASISGIGQSPSGLLEGSTVFGIFLDGYDSQEGIVLGSIPAIPLKSSDQKAYSDQRASFVEFPKINVKVNYDSGIFQSIEDVDQGTYPRYLDAPDTSASAKGDPSAIAALKTASRAAGQIGVPIAFSGTWSEPANPYAARYPFNHVQETESGHIFEMDDTRSKERVHLAHRTGTFLEFLPDGSRVDKAANDQYTIVHRDSFEHVERTKVITVDSGLKILVNKDEGSEGYDLEVKAGGPVNITVRGGNVNLRVENGNVESYINGNLNENITGNVNRTVGGSITVNSGGNQTYVAPIIRLN